MSSSSPSGSSTLQRTAATKPLKARPAGAVAEGRLPQRWAVVAAWGAFLATVPSALWRIGMITGLLPGTDALRRVEADQPGYVWGLSITQLVLGALSLGLVQGWGERVGRIRIPRAVPVVVGGLGALAVSWLVSVRLPLQILDGHRPDEYTVQGSAGTLMMACYAPVFFWGPLLLVAVVGYWLRRRTPAPVTSAGADTVAA